jgi:hypothetical protein
MVARNRLWVACMRLPWRDAWHAARQAVREAGDARTAIAALMAALPGVPWAVGRRQVVPAEVVGMWRRVFGPPA